MTNLNSPITNNPKRNNFTVLIAEDDNSIANLLKMQLELAGYKVLSRSKKKNKGNFSSLLSSLLLLFNPLHFINEDLGLLR